MQLTPEHKAKMAEGRKRAREARQRGSMWGRSPAIEGVVDIISKKEAKEFTRLAAQKRGASPLLKSAPAPWPVTPGEMLGLTATDCCVDCTLERCAITGKPYCGHPNKGGLWPQDKVMPEIVERFNKARKKLLHAEIDRRP